MYVTRIIVRADLSTERLWRALEAAEIAFNRLIDRIGKNLGLAMQAPIRDKVVIEKSEATASVYIACPSQEVADLIIPHVEGLLQLAITVALMEGQK